MGLARRAQRSPRFGSAGTWDISSLCVRCGLGAIFLLAVVFSFVTASTQGADVARKSSDLSEDLKRGLVLYYDFEKKPAGDKILDMSGKGNDGKAVAVEWISDPRRGGVAKIGLTNSHITVPNNDSLNPTQLTLACWIQRTYTDKVCRRIIDKCYDKGFALSMSPGGRMTGKVGFTVNGKWCGSGVAVCDGSWHHIAATYDGNEQRLYVDGVPQGDGKRWEGRSAANTFDLTIGQNPVNPNPKLGEVGASLNGTLDDVAMFNRALSPDEIRELFQSQGGEISAAPAAQERPTPAPESHGTSTPADRIKQIKQLMEQGLIDKEEYDRRVKEVLDAI